MNNRNNEPDPVARFLREQRREVPDHGFTRRVMHCLPRRREHLTWAVPLAGAACAIGLFVALGGFGAVLAWSEDIARSLLAQDWSNPRLQAVGILMLGLSVVGLCHLSSQEE